MPDLFRQSRHVPSMVSGHGPVDQAIGPFFANACPEPGKGTDLDMGQVLIALSVALDITEGSRQATPCVQLAFPATLPGRSVSMLIQPQTSSTPPS